MKRSPLKRKTPMKRKGTHFVCIGEKGQPVSRPIHVKSFKKAFLRAQAALEKALTPCQEFTARSLPVKKAVKRWGINAMSKRRQKESRIRNAQWAEFVEKHPRCEIVSCRCTGATQCRHHIKGKLGKLFLDPQWQIASCDACNMYLETAAGKKWGMAMGFRQDRIADSNYK